MSDAGPVQPRLVDAATFAEAQRTGDARTQNGHLAAIVLDSFRTPPDAAG